MNKTKVGMLDDRSFVADGESERFVYVFKTYARRASKSVNRSFGSKATAESIKRKAFLTSRFPSGVVTWTRLEIAGIVVSHVVEAPFLIGSGDFPQGRTFCRR